MNNQQFRRLLLDKSSSANDAPPTGAHKPASPTSLGSRKSAFVPLTPRAVKGSDHDDFIRQVRERNAALQPKKTFKSSAPKGVKYAAGYRDRAKARQETSDEDGKAARIKALEEQMKLGQISPEVFEQVRDEITGGDVSSTHLVKGLDRKLLERVRRGEDVLGVRGGEGSAPAPDVDEELDKLGAQEVKTVERAKSEKHGTKASPPLLAGKKRTRDEIMAELKAQRQAAAQAKAVPTLDNTRWRRVGEKQHSRIEIDRKGREVLITVDEDGVVKRKVRKTASDDTTHDAGSTIVMPDNKKAVLGADVAINGSFALAASVESKEENDDDDIFEGVGTEYNPLGDEDDDDAKGENVEDQAHEVALEKAHAKGDGASLEPANGANKGETTVSQGAEALPQSRNYFNDTATKAQEAPIDYLAGIQNVLKKAASIDATKEDVLEAPVDDDLEERQARLKRRAELLAQRDRDLDDIDMGFGSSRLEDEADLDDQKVRLSNWKSTARDEHDEGESRGKKSRKPKKRKGDVNNVADIMRVIEKRKEAE